MSKYGFKVEGIWPIKPKAMVDKILPSEVYIVAINNIEDEK